MTADTTDRGGAGLTLAALAAAMLGLAIAVSRYAYDGGTNGLTVATCRGLVLLLGLWLFCLATRRRMRLPFADWLHCAGLGVLMSMMFYGNVGAVEFIDIGLVALLFFTFPPMIAVINIVVLREAVPWPKLLAVAAAFVGLAMMLGVSVDNADWRGLALALGAAVAAAWNAVWLGRRTRHLDTIVVTLHMATIAALTLVVLTLANDSLQWPTAPIGWFGLAGVVVLQCSGVPMYFVAIGMIGALKCGMITNVQPVVSIVAAFLLFGEVLGPLELAGGVLVLGGIFLMQWHDGRTRRAEAAA